MDDQTRAALDTETPVNPYSLPGALNTAAAHANTLWLLFLALMAYLGLAVGGLTHRDLLMNDGIALPFLQTRIDLTRFFVVAPALLALAHLGLVAHLAPLARQARAFDDAVQLLESTDLRTHPLRLNLGGFFLVQAIAGPERSRIIGAFLHGVGWTTLLVLPLALLATMQIAMLPFHDAALTAWQRGIVLADVALVLLAGIFLLRPETSFPGALLRLVMKGPISLGLGLGILAAVAWVSLAASSSDRSALLGLFPRNLVVTDTSLVSGGAAGAAGTLSVRGRDLRFARLDRVDLRGADLTGANLDDASLVGADLRGDELGCVDTPILLAQPEIRKKAGCFSAQRADFSSARLADARLVGADLRGARFDDGGLQRADLRESLMAGATFERGKLQRANLAASLGGASFVQANLQGASLAGAGLAAADFTGARLQGASLASAQLSGAVLREADLAGADLAQAKLYGADLRGAKLHGADLTGAVVWQAAPPAADATALATVATIALRAPEKADLEALKAAVAKAAALPAARRTADLTGLLQVAPDQGWAGSSDGQAWAALLRGNQAAMHEAFKAQLGVELGRLACGTRFADGAVAHGILQRALSASFKGDPGPLYERLRAADCPAGKAVSPLALVDLAAVVQAAKLAAPALLPEPQAVQQ